MKNIDFPVMQIELNKGMDRRYWVKFINSLSGFKSVNLVGTINSLRVSNLSIISSAFHLGADPALMGFVVRPHSDKSPRHTLENIQETGFYTLNAVTEGFYKKAHQASARYKSEESEFQACGLGEQYIEGFKAPFVNESPLKMSLKLIEVMPVKHNNTSIIVGEIKNVYLSSDLISSDGYLDLESMGVVCVSSLDSYHKTVRVSRLSYAKPEQEPYMLNLDGK